MKNALLILLAASTLVLGVVCAVQWRQLGKQRTQLAALRSEVEQKTREVAELQSSQELLSRQRREALEQAADLAAKLQTERLAGATLAGRAAAAAEAPDRPAAKGKRGLGDFFSKMMGDPEMRKMIRESQRATLDQLYGPLFKQMGLTPEETERFKELMLDQTMRGAERAQSLFAGGLTNRAEMLATVTAEQKAFEEELRQFLGETRYAQFQEYQQTVGERAQLSQLRQRLTGENALSDAQAEQLLALMKEEKKSVAAELGQAFPSPGQDAANMEAMFSEEGVEKLLRAQETVNQRVLERARGVLSEAQLSAFAAFQTNQLQLMRMGMNMARRFMTAE